MHLAIHFKSMRRMLIIAILIICLAVAVVFAILQSRAVITGNTISTASADLLVSGDGINFSHSIAGFNFEGIVPGGYPAPIDGYAIYLKNTGSTPLSLGLSADGMPPNPDSADLSKINVALTDTSGNSAPRGFILQLLFGSDQPIEGDLVPGATRQYKLQVLAADDAEPGKTVSNVNFVFTGTARDPNEPH